MAKHLLAIIGVIAVVMGFLVTQQIRTIHMLNHTAQVQEGKTLSFLVTNAEKYNLTARRQVAALSARIAGLGATPNLGAIHASLQKTQTLAGLTPVTGTGVTVVIHDATAPAFPGEPPILELVHDQYVLRVVALLSGAGAQAIAINGQRYTATTSIYCAGPTIRINGVPYASPYVVQAVGPVGPMLKAMQGDPDIQGWAQLVSIKFHSVKRLEIPAFRGPVHLSIAKPVKIGG